MPSDVSVSVLIPNERGLERRAAAARAGPDRRGQRVPVRLRDAQPQQRQPLGRGVAGGVERVLGRAREAGLRCEGVISTVVRLPLRGPRPARARARDRAPRCATAGAAGDRLRRHHRDGQPARRCEGFFRTARARLASEVELTAHFHNTRGVRASPTCSPRSRPGSRASSRASASSAAARCRRARPATSPARTSSRCSTRWASTTGVDLPALSACARRAQEILGRPLGSHTLVAGPVDWGSSRAWPPS